MKHAIATCAGLLALMASPATVFGLEEGRGDGRALTLSEVVSIARSRGTEAREARAVAEGRAAAADAAIAGYLPNARANVSGERTYLHSYQPDPTTGGATLRGTPNAYLDSNVSMTVGWTAWDFGRTTSAVGAARAEARSATSLASSASNDVARQAATLFLTAVFDEELVAVAQATVQLRERHATLSRGLVSAGLRPPIEEARARVELLLAKLEVTKAEQRLAQDKVDLATALFMDSRDAMKLVRPTVLPALTADARYAAELALKNRPEVTAAAASVEAEEENVDAAKAERMPSIGLAITGTHRTTKSDDDPRIVPMKSLTAMLTVSVPIFDWGVWGRIPVARAGLAAAESRRAGVHARVQGEAARAAHALRSATTLVDQAKAARELAAAALVVIEARYQAGRDGPFDLIEAAKADADARRETVRAELALAIATIDALAATGRMSELAR